MTSASGTPGPWRWPLVKPPALGPGARLAAIAPASAFDVPAFHAGLGELATLGFEVVYDESVFARERYLAGRAGLRAAALARAWQDPSVSGIVAIRGGYGSVQLLPLIDADVPRRHPKVLVGYSDVTTLHMWLGQLGQVAFQGPMIEGRFARGAARYDQDTFLRAVTDPNPLGELPAPDLESFVDGEAVGPVFGGTLTQVAASLGTPFAFEPPPGCVLFLEDVAERPYRLDRLLMQLRLAGVLSRAAAIVLGTFPGCDEPGGEATARETLASLLGEFPGPVVFGLPVGHVEGAAVTLPLGVQTRVIGGPTPRVIIEEGAVS